MTEARPPARTPVAAALLDAARTMSDALARLEFAPPVTHVYDPLRYAWAPYEDYVTRYGATRKRVVLLGMNPGPFGMMQTGVPFGEVAAVRGWMGIDAPVGRPARMHPKRPVDGFACARSEVSGRRLWGWAADRFGTAAAFFRHWFVLNYCPLGFLEASGRNLTPDRLPPATLAAVHDACDRHLAAALAALDPDWAIGVGGYAERRLRAVLGDGRGDGRGGGRGDAAGAVPRRRPVRIGQILHPSPANPAANRGWPEAVDAAIAALGIDIPDGDRRARESRKDPHPDAARPRARRGGTPVPRPGR